MPRDTISHLQADIDAMIYADESTAVANLVTTAQLSKTDRARISARAACLVRDIRASADPGKQTTQRAGPSFGRRDLSPKLWTSNAAADEECEKNR